MTLSVTHTYRRGGARVTVRETRTADGAAPCFSLSGASTPYPDCVQVSSAHDTLDAAEARAYELLDQWAPEPATPAADNSAFRPATVLPDSVLATFNRAV